MGELAILGHEGDTKITWSRDNTDEVDIARQTFNDLRAKGFTAFEAEKDGSQGRRMDTFNPQAERLIMVPRMQGG